MTIPATESLRRVSVLFIDADGVFFSGDELRLIFQNDVVLIKRRSLIDGQGLSFMREMGIRVVFVSGDGEPLQSIVDKINALPSVKSGRWHEAVFAPIGSDKKSRVEAWLALHAVSGDACAYMGDDIDDYEAMQMLKAQGGLTVAPANCTRRIRSIADVITAARAAEGSLREFAELLLDAYSRDEREFPVV
ncbi:MAG: HAD hydrolase family protein [Candidatus Pacebacteria bacterium]|nr:HAD hydrolase family protein [Candidatus Paceibacterota bacterium]